MPKTPPCGPDCVQINGNIIEQNYDMINDDVCNVCNKTQESHDKQGQYNDANDLMDKNINAIVDKFLKNKMVNNQYIPDFIERRMYANMIKLMIGLLKETAETSSINVLGHTISFKIDPISDTSPCI